MSRSALRSKMICTADATWLANHLAADGKGLRSRHIALTGSLVQTVWLNAGELLASFQTITLLVLTTPRVQ